MAAPSVVTGTADQKLCLYRRLNASRVSFFVGIGVKVLCGLLSFGAAWHVIEYFRRQRLRIVKRQDLEAEIGIWPFFVAETHREIVKQMKTNYFEEKELMKNEPHWKVGTLFGEYIYHARTLLAPPHCEMLAHARPELEVLYKSDFLAR